MQAHGFLNRPSEDVNLFTAWEHRSDFAAAVDAVVDGYRDGGYTVEITQRFDTFARLAVTDPAQLDHPYKVELAANWRALPPVMMDIGPVLLADDVVAGKMSALYTRAEPRDFLDVDAAVATARYTRTRLLELAEQADAGFDRRRLWRRPCSHRRAARTLCAVARADPRRPAVAHPASAPPRCSTWSWSCGAASGALFNGRVTATVPTVGISGRQLDVPAPLETELVVEVNSAVDRRCINSRDSPMCAVAS